MTATCHHKRRRCRKASLARLLIDASTLDDYDYIQRTERHEPGHGLSIDFLTALGSVELSITASASTGKMAAIGILKIVLLVGWAYAMESVARDNQPMLVIQLTAHPTPQHTASDVPAGSTENSSTTTYTAYDDMSWAIMSDQMSAAGIGRQKAAYHEFIASCARVASASYCASQENWRMQMNMYQTRSVYNYTQAGYLKSKAPEELYQLVRSFFDRNKDQLSEEWQDITTFHNNWQVPTRIVRVDNETLPGGGQSLSAQIADVVRPLVENWIGMRLAVTSVYGVRVYGNQSILTPHVDRLPLVSSVIINVDQDVDEDWPLEVYDHDGIAHNITLLPSEMLFYESATVIHGRPFPLHGKVSAAQSMFVLFRSLVGIGRLRRAHSCSPLPSVLCEHLYSL
jgi:hypothetical protein